MADLVNYLKQQKNNLELEKKSLIANIKENIQSDIQSSQLSDALKQLFTEVSLTIEVGTYNELPLPSITINIDGAEIEYSAVKDNKYDLSFDERRMMEGTEIISSYSTTTLSFNRNDLKIDSSENTLEETLEQATHMYKFDKAVRHLTETMNEFAVPFVEMYYERYNEVVKDINVINQTIKQNLRSVKNEWIDGVLNGTEKVTIKPQYSEEFLLRDSDNGDVYEDTSDRNHKNYGDEVVSVKLKEVPKWFGARYKGKDDTKHEDSSLLLIDEVTKKPRGLYNVWIQWGTVDGMTEVTFTKENLESVLGTIWEWNNEIVEPNAWTNRREQSFSDWLDNQIEGKSIKHFTKEEILNNTIELGNWYKIFEKGKVAA